MLVDALLVTEEFGTERQQYTRLYVLDSRWILQVKHYNYKFNPENRTFNFESKEEAREKLLYYITVLDDSKRTLHIYQDDLGLFDQVSEMEMQVDRYWF